MTTGYTPNLMSETMIHEVEMYRKLFDQTFYNSYFIDPNYKVLAWNKNGEEAVKKYFNAQIAVGDDFINYNLPHEIDNFKRLFNESLTGKQLDFEIELMISPGVTQFYHVMFIPIEDSEGGVMGICFSMKDITERRIREYELFKAKTKAEAAVAAKQDFLASLSHEIRTPLNSILGISDLLLEKKEGEEQTHLLKTLRFSSEQLLELINEILDFSKIESGKTQVVLSSVNIRELCKNVLSSFETRAGFRKIRLDYSTSASLPELVLADKLKLIQILTNLLSNALKFTEKGFVKLQLELLSQIESSVTISFIVSDSGIGISEENLCHIFELFAQADVSTEQKYGGTGLGLTIAKRLVEMMKGTLSVKSELGKGSVFSFSLEFEICNPQKDYSYSPIQPAALLGDNESLKHMKVLLVEDNEINKFVAEEFLRKFGVKSDWAHNGLKAIQLLQSKAYDLILMDIQMAGMDGLTATKYIRSLDDDYFKQIPIIALTADVLTESVNKQNGFNDFLIKPINKQILKDILMKYDMNNKSVSQAV